MANKVIGDVGTSCPWCGKQFTFIEKDGGWLAFCSNSYCIVVPSCKHDTRENLEAALRDRIT